MRRTVSIAAAVTLAVVAAACANEGSSTSSGGTSIATSAQGASGASGGGPYGYGDGGGDTGSAGGGGGPSSGSVVVANYSFTPSTVKVASGAKLELKNTNPQTPHTFTVTGQGIDVSLDPGSTSTVTIDLPPGTYPFICRFHERSGMTGTLVVQ